jgi:hypothetical protein
VVQEVLAGVDELLPEWRTGFARRSFFERFPRITSQLRAR